MICLTCHGPNDLTLGYVSRESSLIIAQLELDIVIFSSKVKDIRPKTERERKEKQKERKGIWLATLKKRNPHGKMCFHQQKETKCCSEM